MAALESSYFDALSGLYVPWQADTPSDPKLIYYNDAVAKELGLDWSEADALRYLSGSAEVLAGKTLAQAYAGHQFGGFSPQLGDGRQVLLGEAVTDNGRFDIALKGSGRTPFSRGGDGKAALGPVLREYLMGEAMHALGVPTTRGLAVVTTGEDVYREVPLPGAILTRVAASHIRVGTFQFYAARQDADNLSRLLDYTLARHVPEPAADNSALALLIHARDVQARLMADWMLIGFIHGVMNTDNMALSGETIDFGPCAFMDAYDPATVFSSIDHGGRYAYGNQPSIALWNLSRLAEALLTLIDTDQDRAIAQATETLEPFGDVYEAAMTAGWAQKLHLPETVAADLTPKLLTDMQAGGLDFTETFWRLSRVAEGIEDPEADIGLSADTASVVKTAFKAHGAPKHGEKIRSATPAYIPRNHLVEDALTAAVHNQDFDPFGRLLKRLKKPYEAHHPDPDFAKAPLSPDPSYKTFCGT